MSCRRIFLGLLVVAVLFSTFNVKPAKAVWPVVGSVALKATERAVAHSVVRAVGIKGTTKSAKEKAMEAWFSRLPEEQATHLRLAVNNAQPVEGKPGWLKVVVSGLLFITGLDVALEIWDMIQSGSPIERMSYVPDKDDEILQFDENIYGTLVPNVIIEWYTSEVKVQPWYYRWPDGSISHNIMNFRSTYAGAKSTWTSLGVRYDGVNSSGDHVYYWRYMYQRSGEWVVVEPLSFTVKAGAEGHLVRSPITNVEWEPIPLPEIDPARQYEIIFPDPVVYPSIYPEPEQYPLPEIVPVTEPVPDPAPEPNPEPNPDPKPSPEPNPWPEPGPEPFPDPVPNPPNPFEPSEPEKINWEKLRGIPAIITTKFPFSLPWDIYHLLSLLNYQPCAPVIEVNEDFMGMNFQFEIDFSFLDPYVPFFRWFIVIGYAVFLILSVRKLMGGGV